MSASTQWPLTGTRTAKVGQTIKNSLVKPKQTGPKNKRVERDFHAVRYSFRPSSIDAERPASLESTPYKDDQGSVSKITLERPITNKEDVHVFEGVEKPMQTEYDCVLIWDESLQTLVLERVDTQITLSHKGQRPPSKRTASNSPASTPMPEPLASTPLAVPPVKREAAFDENPKPPVKPAPLSTRPMPFKSKSKPAAATAASSQSPTVPTAPPVASTSTAAKPKPRPVKRDPAPTLPANPPRSPPKPFGGLQLPSADSFVGILAAPPVSATPASVPQVKSEPTPAAVVDPVVENEEDEEDDMEEVELDETHFSPSGDNPPTPAPEPTLAPPEPAVRTFSSSFVMEEDEGDEEIFDEAAFAAEMEIGMEEEGEGEDEEDDDDMEAVEPVSAGPPVSLNAYAGGVEDEYSDSDSD